MATALNVLDVLLIATAAALQVIVMVAPAPVRQIARHPADVCQASAFNAFLIAPLALRRVIVTAAAGLVRRIAPRLAAVMCQASA